jgi:hypothetical protein
MPLAPTVGFLVFTPPVAASLSRVVRTTVIDARPDGAGRLMLHWNPTDASLTFDTRLSPSMPEARDLVRRARRLLPSIGEVEPEAVRIAIRPIPGDRNSPQMSTPATQLPSWVDWSKALGTLALLTFAGVISFLSYLIARWQGRIAKERIRLNLYNRRFEIFRGIFDFYEALISWSGTPEQIAVRGDFSERTRSLDFYWGHWRADHRFYGGLSRAA